LVILVPLQKASGLYIKSSVPNYYRNQVEQGRGNKVSEWGYVTEQLQTKVKRWQGIVLAHDTEEKTKMDYVEFPPKINWGLPHGISDAKRDVFWD
jgi:hypothetical protein